MRALKMMTCAKNFFFDLLPRLFAHKRVSSSVVNQVAKSDFCCCCSTSCWWPILHTRAKKKKSQVQVLLFSAWNSLVKAHISEYILWIDLKIMHKKLWLDGLLVFFLPAGDKGWLHDLTKYSNARFILHNYERCNELFCCPLYGN